MVISRLDPPVVAYLAIPCRVEPVESRHIHDYGSFGQKVLLEGREETTVVVDVLQHIRKKDRAVLLVAERVDVPLDDSDLGISSESLPKRSNTSRGRVERRHMSTARDMTGHGPIARADIEDRRSEVWGTKIGDPPDVVGLRLICDARVVSFSAITQCPGMNIL